MLSEGVPEAPGVTTDRAPAPVATAVPPAWDLEVEVSVEEEAVVAEVGDADRLSRLQK